ncbi:tetratricopeptide repeat protein [Solimonas sp. SE-A11]|uniref:tetratricopeptide repeat protein n=1 Tax=Solimonas sp. SE-A11 TaxID=3054954 RepID=UPI00259CAA6C|nr:tetratricopeptide repeat protein [Solimonas sp. SE-A11]MDM4768825.1 tetratricopeptide repeat protein [Solimonas sp. SE-A11]
MKASSKLQLALVLALGATVSACKTSPERPAPPDRPGAEATAPKPPDKGDPKARFAAALEQLKGKQFQEAEEALTSLTKDFPEYSGPWTNLGIIYFNSNRKGPAAAAFNKAAVLNQDNAVAFNYLGMLARETKDYPRAQMAYEKALKLEPDNALVHYNLAILLDEYLKRPADALPHYKDYQRLSGKQDLKVIAWVAEIESNIAKAAPPPAAAPAVSPSATPAAPAGQPQPKSGAAQTRPRAAEQAK